MLSEIVFLGFKAWDLCSPGRSEEFRERETRAASETERWEPPRRGPEARDALFTSDHHVRARPFRPP